MKRTYKYWMKFYASRIILAGLLTVVFVISGAYSFVYSPPSDGLIVDSKGDSRVVVVERSEVIELQAEYNPDKEKAFCIFGEKTDGNFYVEDIDKAEMGYQSRSGVSFDCNPRIKDRAVEMLQRPSYKILGVVHTHPPHDLNHYQSRVDSVTMAWSNLEYELSGIFDENRLHFYTTKSTVDSLRVIEK